MAQGVLGQRAAVFDDGFVVAEGFVQLGPFKAFQFGADGPQVFGVEEPHRARPREHGALGRSQRKPVAPDESAPVHFSQDIREILRARQFFPFGGQGAAHLFGRHEAIAGDRGEHVEVERGKSGLFHGVEVTGAAFGRLFLWGAFGPPLVCGRCGPYGRAPSLRGWV